MERKEFLQLQFVSLREEIKDTKARIFKTVTAGLTLIPAASFVAHSYKVDILLLSMPLLVVVIGLLYLSENHAMMRCGQYIKEHIEPHVDEVIGWEKWLSTPDAYRKRTVDLYVFVAFYLLYLVYYCASSYIAVTFARANYGLLWSVICAGCYVVLGIWYAVFLFRNQLHSTTTITRDVSEAE